MDRTDNELRSCGCNVICSRIFTEFDHTICDKAFFTESVGERFLILKDWLGKTERLIREASYLIIVKLKKINFFYNYARKKKNYSNGR